MNGGFARVNGTRGSVSAIAGSGDSSLACRYWTFRTNLNVAKPAERAPFRHCRVHRSEHLAQNAVEQCAFLFGQRCPKSVDCFQASKKKLVANGMTLIGEAQRNCAPVLTLATLNKTISNQPVNKPNGTPMRQTKDAAEPIVGQSGSMSDDDQCLKSKVQTSVMSKSSSGTCHPV